MPCFVILEHDHPILHWDFMLEFGSALRTWRLSSPPGAEGSISAELLGDHRIAYLDYEGPVSGNRGSVKQWDRGEYAILEQSAERVVVRLNGICVIGTATLQRTRGAWSLDYLPE